MPNFMRPALTASVATKMMTPLPNLNKKKTPRDKKETRGKDESPGKQAAQTRHATRRKRHQYELNLPPVVMHMNNRKT